MSANELSLTFLLKANGAQASAELQRLTAQLSSQLANLNKPGDGAAAAPISVQRQQAQAAIGLQKEVTASVVNETHTRSQAIQTAARGELTVKQQLAAAASLQRQRSAALIAQWKQEEKAALQTAAGTKSFRDVLQQLSATVATFQGPLGAVSGRISSLGSVVGSTGASLGEMSTEAAAAGGSIAAIAGPVGIAVVAIAALSAGLIVISKELFELAKSAAEFQGRMFDLAQQTGLAVETLSALEVVARTTGGNIDNIAQSVFNFQRKLDDAQDPLSKTGQLFADLGVKTGDTESALRSAFTALAAMQEGFAQTNAAAELFGARGGKQILAILKETNGDLDGAIKRFREMGILIETDAARAADKFNDQLAELDFQLRASSAVAAKELIPAFIDIIRVTGDLVRDLSPLLKAFSNLAGPVVRSVGQGMKGLGIVVGFLTQDYRALAEAIKESNEQATIFRDINSQAIATINVPGPSSVTLPTKTPLGTAQEAAQTADAVTAIVKRAAAEQKQALTELFERGRINRQQEAEGVIENNRKIFKSESDRIQSELDLKEREIKTIQERTDISEREKQDTIRKSGEEVQKLQHQQLDAESLFTTTSREIRAKAAKERADSQRNEERNALDNLLADFDRQIKVIEGQIAREERVETDGLTVIEALERNKIDERRKSLEKQKEIGFLTIENQKEVNREIEKLEREANQLKDAQNERRLQRDRDAAKQTKEIKQGEIDTAIELQRIVGERTIGALESLGRLRVKTEEQVAREVLQVKLRLIDAEIEATEARLKAAGLIVNVGERTKAEAELNNQLKILKEQRVSIEADGNRDIDEKRQEDLDSARRYAEDLKRLQEETVDIELDTQRERLDILRISFASRKDIIRAQRDLELAEENNRHRRATESINDQKAEVDEEIKVLEKHLERMKVGTQEEIDEHNRLIESLEKLRQKRLELQRQQEAEDERSQTRQRRTTDAAKRKEKEVDPFDFDLEKIAKEIKDSIVPINDILIDSFHQVSDAIGETVANWVLLGETGPAIGRKILAQALANLAKEATVNALKETALGFATLFFNPAESAAHFTAAGIWAAVAGGSALLGRSVAGDLFKQKTASAGGLPSSSRESGQLNPLAFNRNQPQQQTQIVRHEHVLKIQTNDSHIIETIGKNWKTAGGLRELVFNDG